MLDDEWHDAITKTFVEEEEATDTSIAVLEWLDTLEASIVFGKDMNGHALLGLIPLFQRVYVQNY
ncbi:MAG: hypothetical protein Q4E68_00980 [Prevotellaceae bacterium]|nr:hypothetical protein [Prevotellaceae bacterium]